MHEGHDFAPLENYWNTKVYATADGIVKKSGSHPTYGNYVEIDHGDGVVTAYAHLRVIGWRVSKNKDYLRCCIVRNQDLMKNQNNYLNSKINTEKR